MLVQKTSPFNPLFSVRNMLVRRRTIAKVTEGRLAYSPDLSDWTDLVTQEAACRAGTGPVGAQWLKAVATHPGDHVLGSTRCAETPSDLHVHGRIYQRSLKEAAAKITVIKQVRPQASSMLRTCQEACGPPCSHGSPCLETGSRGDPFYSLLMSAALCFPVHGPLQGLAPWWN